MIPVYLGLFCMGAGCTVLLPLLVLPFYPAECIYAWWYLYPGAAALAAGGLITYAARTKLQKTGGEQQNRLKLHQDSAVVLAGWLTAIAVNALPFILSGTYTVTQAVFESVSGWTTTGLSVVDVDKAPHILLMHRSIMLFFGGIGIILSVLFFRSGSGGLRLYTAEGHADMLAPDVGKSARYITSIYAGYIAGGTALYRIVGMNWFDAVNHSIAALSTGGFSTHSESIGYFHSAAVEAVTVILMLLGSTNFLVHLYMLTGRWKNVFLYCETKTAAVVLAFSIPSASFGIYLTLAPYAGHIGAGIRAAVFQTVSALTTTGFQTVESFDGIHPSLLLLFTVLMLIGGGSGSTAGGIKQYRLYTACKDLYWTIRDSCTGKMTVNPHHIHSQNRILTAEESGRREVLSFIFIYMICFWAETGILSLYGHPVGNCMFEAASALGTVGLSCGIMVSGAPAPVLWTGSVLMFLGRVELYLVFFGSIRILQDIRSRLQTAVLHKKGRI
jgi:trk system potassium uptake protein